MGVYQKQMTRLALSSRAVKEGRAMIDGTKDYCKFSAHCQFHPKGQGCVCRHFPKTVEECEEHRRLKEISEKSELAASRSG